jgi:hypothetical protein
MSLFIEDERIPPLENGKRRKRLQPGIESPCPGLTILDLPLERALNPRLEICHVSAGVGEMPAWIVAKHGRPQIRHAIASVPDGPPEADFGPSSRFVKPLRQSVQNGNHPVLGPARGNPAELLPSGQNLKSDSSV